MTQAFWIAPLSPAVGVVGADHRMLGTLESMVVDKSTGQSRYALIKESDSGAAPTELHPVPWNALGFDESSNRYVVPLDRAQLHAGPCLGDRSHLDHVLFKQLCRRYGLSLSGHARC